MANKDIEKMTSELINFLKEIPDDDVDEWSEDVLRIINNASAKDLERWEKADKLHRLFDLDLDKLARIINMIPDYKSKTNLGAKRKREEPEQITRTKRIPGPYVYRVYPSNH